MSLLDKIKMDVSEEETQTVDQQVTENLTKEERKALKKAKRTGFTETIKDDYDDSDRTLADSDAHRDVVYTPPSTIRQIGICYMTQMKRLTKEKSIWLLVILLGLMPVIYILINKFMGMASSHITNISLALPLFGMPVITMLICSAVCGSMLPREYNERTVYLSMPLPMSRFSFYISKFVAGLTLCWGVIAAAYGIATLLVMLYSGADVTYTTAMVKSLLIMFASTFAICSFVYMLSASSKRGATLKSLILLVVGLPIIPVIVWVLPSFEAFSSVAEPLTTVGNALQYLPVLGPDLALYNLGESPFAAMLGMKCISLPSFAAMAVSTMAPITLTADATIMCIVSVLIGILCLFRGYRRIKRRDM